MAGEAMDICLRVLKESNQISFDSYSVRNIVLIISHITFRDCRVTFFPTTFLEIAVYPNRKALLHSMTKLFVISSKTPSSDTVSKK